MPSSRSCRLEQIAWNDPEVAACCSDPMDHNMWPLDEVDPSKARFPCCIVWTPLPIVSWLAPFFGHVGICREDGTILDFSGSNFVNIDNFAFGPVARYVQVDRKRCCFPLSMSSHTCKHGYRHTEKGAATSWDDALRQITEHYHHKSYNLFTCNCHSFVASCLNRASYMSVGWNVVSVGALVLARGQWVDGMSVVRSFLPFAAAVVLGVRVAGWAFLAGLASFSLLLVGWFLLGSYCMKSLIECD